MTQDMSAIDIFSAESGVPGTWYGSGLTYCVRPFMLNPAISTSSLERGVVGECSRAEAGKIALRVASNPIENRLLNSLDADVRARLLPNLSFVELHRGDVLVEAGENPAEVFFPLPGTMVSLVVANDDGTGVEVGVIGYEGLVGMSALLGESASPYQGITQIAGAAYRVKSELMLREFDHSASLRKRILRYANFLTAQSAQTALCNRLHPVEERLARWLLICQDRAGAETMNLTHELLSQMLGTRRSTVSLSASILQNAGLIRYLHGKVKILDRRGLERTSCSCYASLARQSAEFNGK